MIRRRHPGNFGMDVPALIPDRLMTLATDETTGPLLISAALFIAVLSNFILRGTYFVLGPMLATTDS